MSTSMQAFRAQLISNAEPAPLLRGLAQLTQMGRQIFAKLTLFWVNW